MAKQKLLYIMGIDWKWIFQRPQIIEQYLETKYDVTVIYPRSILQWRPRKKVQLLPNHKILWTLPFQEKNNIMRFVSGCISKSLFKDVNEYEVIWIGYPLYYRYIKKDFAGKIIYDCMDNHETLYPDPKRIENIRMQEHELVSKCDVLLTSGKLLYQKWQGTKGQKALVRNGCSINTLIPPKKSLFKKKYILGYFGTISSWFDYDILLKSLQEESFVEYHLIGPVQSKLETPCSGIVFEGVVPHRELCEKTKDYDCFIMPFKINDIVKWVDPVKLYEYIAFGKCIIVPFYEEIQHFEEYVYFYENYEEYIALLYTLSSKGFPPKFSAEKQKEFINRNSWDARFHEINRLLTNL